MRVTKHESWTGAAVQVAVNADTLRYLRDLAVMQRLIFSGPNLYAMVSK